MLLQPNCRTYKMKVRVCFEKLLPIFQATELQVSWGKQSSYSPEWEPRITEHRLIILCIALSCHLQNLASNVRLMTESAGSYSYVSVGVKKRNSLESWRLFSLSFFNLFAPELFFLILAHPVYKMWIIQETNTLELWNKLHFEVEKKGWVYTVFKIFSTYICWINIWNATLEVSGAVRPL